MGNSRKSRVRAILVVTIVCIILFSANYTSLGKSDSPIVINADDSYTSSANVTLTLSSVDGNTYLMHFSNDGSFKYDDLEPYSTSKAWTLTGGEGLNTVYVQFLNEFSLELGTYSDTIILDTQPPSLTISSPEPDSWFKASSIAVSGTASDIGSGLSKVEYQVDSTLTAWSPASGTQEWSFTVPPLSNGVHTIYVRATDNLDKTTLDSVVINVDTVAPTSSVSSLSTYQSSSSFAVSYSSQDTYSGIKNVHLLVKAPGSLSYTDLGAWFSGNSYTPTAGNGLYMFYTIATDNAGNIEGAPTVADASTTVDTQAPNGSIEINGGALYTTSNIVTLTLSADVDVQYMKFSTNAGSTWTTYEAYSPSKQFTLPSGDGDKTVSVKFKDYAGLESTGTISDSITLDTVAPTTTCSLSGTLVAGETNWYTEKVQVTLSPDDAGSRIKVTYYKRDNAANYEVYTSPFDITAKGTTIIYYYSIDKAGRTETPQTTAVNIAYPVTFTANGLPSGSNWSVTLDSKTKSSTESSITFQAKTGTHNWNVTKAISGGTGIQYAPSQPQGTIDASLQTTLAISYVQQYYLTVTSAYGNPIGAGWYDSGSTANFAVTSPVSNSTGSRYVFTMWTGDSSSTSPSGSIIMNSAKTLTANWQTQYQVTFAVAPTAGGTTSPSGAIWVNAGGEVSTSATAASINYKFSSWNTTVGTISSSTSPSTTVTITGSGTVTANFEQVQTQEPTPTPAPTVNPTSNPPQGQNPTPRPTAKPTTANPTPTPTVTVAPSNFVSKSILASTSDGSSTYLTIYGNIDDSEISNAVLTKDQNTGETTLSLTLIGQSGANSFCNLTVPRRAITSDTVPTVYINNQIVNNQGYMQDNNYVYVWYNTFLSTYDLSVVFSGKSDFPLWPIGIVIGVSIALVAGIVTPRLKSKGNPPLVAKNEFVVSDYVISDGVLKFYNRQGLLANKRVPVREIPISTISNIEHFWNELTITWNGVIDTFRKKKNYESFNEEVTAKVQAIMDENKRALEKQEKIYIRNTNVEAILNDSLPVVDVVFDVLRGLHAKRVDWAKIEDTSAILGQSINLTTQSLPALSLDFTQLSIAISKQDPREVANQARVVLKAILEYFNRLRLMDTVPDAHPNLDQVAMLVNSYYLLNDLMLGKLVSQKENPREIHSLERSLQKLSKDTKFKMDLEDLRNRIGSINADESTTDDVIGDTRELFKDQILQLYSSN